MVKFSVIITTYNRAEFLKNALDSLIAQTENDWEAIVIDDGSIDNTTAIVQQYIHQEYPIKYYKQINSGDALAKNKGISLSSGEFITFLDSDDAYEMHHLENRKNILDQHKNIQLLHGGVKIIGDEFVPDIHNLNQQIHLSDCVIGATFFIRRDIISLVTGIKPMALGSDADLFERATMLGLNIMKTDIPTYIYNRVNENSITHQFAKSAKQ